MYYTQDAVKDVNSRWALASLFFAFGTVALMFSFVPSIATMLLDHYTVQLIDTNIKLLAVMVFWGIVGLIIAWRLTRSIMNEKRTDLQKAVKFRCSHCKSEDLRFESTTKFEPIVQRFVVSDVNLNNLHWCRTCAKDVSVETVPMFPELQND